MEIKHPLKWNELYPIQTVLMDLASQENCDGEPYDQIAITAQYIDQLEYVIKTLQGRDSE